MKQTLAPVISRLEVMPGTHLIRLEAPGIAAAAQPGQFVMVRCGEETLLRRPFSVHQADKGGVSLLVRVAGRGTRWLAQLKAGDSVDVLGPMGKGYAIPHGAGNLLLLAGGIGIAPLRFLADRAFRRGLKVTIVMGASTAAHLLPISYPLEPPEDGVMPASIHVVNATDDGSEGFKGPLTDLIAAYIDHGDQVFACGPVGMYRSMARMPELKNKPVQISLEIMMGCGLGVCYGCTIRTKSGLRQVCQDGPVFALEDIIWEEIGEI